MPSPVTASAEPEASPVQRHVAGGHTAQLAGGGQRSSHSAQLACALEMRPQRRQAGEDRFHPSRGRAGDGGDADLFRADGGDVGLAQIAPMHLHHARPWRHPVMTAGAETAAQDLSLAQAHRLAHARGLAIRADRVAIGAGFAVQTRLRGCFSAMCTRLPQASRTPSSWQRSTSSEWSCRRRMPMPLPRSKCAAAWWRPERNAMPSKAAPSCPVTWIPRRGQVFSCIRHQALAAGLVDGREKSIGDQNIQTFLPQCDRGCEAGRAATDDECITADHSALSITTPAATSRSRIPDPWPPARCAIPAWAGDGS